MCQPIMKLRPGQPESERQLYRSHLKDYEMRIKQTFNCSHTEEPQTLCIETLMNITFKDELTGDILQLFLISIFKKD